MPLRGPHETHHPGARPDRLKRVAVWGFARLGVQCIEALRAQHIEVVCLVDRRPPPSGYFHGLPVHQVETFLAGDGLASIDGVFLTMVTDTQGPRQQLRAAGFTRPVVNFVNGAALERMLQPALHLPRCLAYDQGEPDRRFLRALAAHLQAKPGPVTLYGAGRTCRYLLAQVPEFATHVAAIVDDDPAQQGQHLAGVKIEPLAAASPNNGIVICATSWRPITAMTRNARKLHPNTEVSDLRMASAHLDPCDIPAAGHRHARPSIYPVEVPEIAVQEQLDFLLIDLPARMLCMMPNGLCAVHNILTQADIRVQTIDCDIIFYHTFHAQRLLDGSDPVTKTGESVVSGDPWNFDNLAGAWEDPQLWALFEEELNTLVEGIAAAKPTMVGFSLHGSNLVLSNHVIKRIRAASPDTLIVVGGYDCVYPEVGRYCCPDFDYMVVFEAEGSLPELVRRVTDGERPTNLPGILAKGDASWRPFIPAPLVHDLDALDFPRYPWADVRLYRNYTGYQVAPVVLTRGCRWSRCSFCAERFQWRQRSATKMVDELQWLSERGCHNIVFNDSDLSGSPELVHAMCKEILRRGLQLSLHGQLRVQKGYSKAYFDVLFQAGFTQLRFGVDAWSKHTLKLQKKGYTLQMIDDVLGYAADAGIQVCINLVLGIPHETDEDIDELIANVVRNREKITQIENLNTLILSAGSVYWERPEALGIRFAEDQGTLQKRYPKTIPPDLWHSVDPFIDQGVRVQRLRRVVQALARAGVAMGAFAEWTAESLQDQDRSAHAMDEAPPDQTLACGS